jgi:hypothetical protein
MPINVSKPQPVRSFASNFTLIGISRVLATRFAHRRGRTCHPCLYRSHSAPTPNRKENRRGGGRCGELRGWPHSDPLALRSSEASIGQYRCPTPSAHRDLIVDPWTKSRSRRQRLRIIATRRASHQRRALRRKPRYTNSTPDRTD